MSSPLISIVIPTFRRPADVVRLLDSIDADLGERTDTQIIVADNDANETARDGVEDFRARTGRNLIYTVAREPGVSNARNAAMAHVRSRWVLFLDDDMEVLPPYLDPLLGAAKSLGTAITFAPAVANLPRGTERWERWLSPLFSRVFDGPTRAVDSTLGTGGCLIDTKGFTLPSPVFDPALNETGGEDDAFFRALMAQGATVGWCADTKAWEHVPEHRATPEYLYRRHFAFGQTPSREAADAGLRGALGVAKWMGVGAVQAGLHGALYLGHRLMRKPSQIGHLGRLAQGLGKVFWWDGLSPKLYGKKAR